MLYSKWDWSHAQVFARRAYPTDSGEADIIYLPPGSAERTKLAESASQLECPLPGCEKPRFSIRNGGDRRDHFFHVDGQPSEGHGPESMAHFYAKHLLGEFLRPRVAGGCTVIVDRDSLTEGGRPDILVRASSGTPLVAYEVQYSPIDLKLWDKRHSNYVTGGVADVWLFAGDHHLKEAGGTYEATALQMHLLENRYPLLFIDPHPENPRVGVARTQQVNEVLAGGPSEYFQTFTVDWAPLAQANVDNNFLQIPGREAQRADVIDLKSGLSKTYHGFCSSTGRNPREGQEQMVKGVTNAMLLREHLAVQAPTGTGKSFGYLLPALAMRRRVVLSTSSKSLQEQLKTKDIPSLAADLGFNIRVAMLQGKSNYLCRLKLNQLLDAQQELFRSGKGQAEMEAISAWSANTETGHRPAGPAVSDAVWSRVSIGSDECLQSECPFIETCFPEKAKKDAAAADVLIVNHDLLVSHLRSPRSFLRGFETVVVDEAHDLPDKASARLTSEIKVSSLARLVDQASKLLGGSVSLAALKTSVSNLDQAIHQAVSPSQGSLEALQEEVRHLRAALDAVSLIARQRISSQPLVPLKLLLKRLESSNKKLGGLWQDGHVTWANTDEGSESGSLKTSPIDVAPFLSLYLYRGRTVILASGTLSLGSSFGPFLKRSGLPEETATLTVPSPFDYKKNVLLFAAPLGSSQGCMPVPGAGSSEEYPQAAANLTESLVLASSGGAFVLCTSFKAVECISEHLKRRLRYQVLKQGDAPTEELIKKFTADGNAVLVGTRTFWQGVDIPGSALRLVVIDKIPFPHREDPVANERRRLAGNSWFKEIDIPEASVPLTQAAGRLIRDVEDWGVVAILDPRLTTKPGYRPLWDALPPSKVTSKVAAVEEFFWTMS